MTLSFRSARLVVLAVWSLAFVWLWSTGEVARYLGPRTSWVVPFGAIALGLATVAYGSYSERGPDARRPLSRGETAGTVAMLAPVVVVFVMAHAALGSLAASRKLASRGIDPGRLEAVLSARASEVSFLELRTAEGHRDYAARNSIQPGRQVSLTGFVMRPASPSGGGFRLARFYITCCVADSIPIDAEILPPGRAPYRKDDWLRVDGLLVRHGRRLAVRAGRITPIAQPANPYLTFNS
jgi:uncharacterized repeat protein (TIGR03943 family)